jgi:tRNA 5-methylaminomethyl-2-thiouridine biosynthesis bifunctional protein
VTESLPAASLAWQGTTPYSEQFDDVYFGRDGAGEVRRVFIDPSDLAAQSNSNLTVAELGFGTGLNFAVLAEDVIKNDSRLHFISFEAHPLCAKDWQQTAEQNAEFSVYQHLANFPLPLLRGWHQRSFAQGRIKLSVFHGDIELGIEDLVSRSTQPVDAWFLDGFAPDRNPKMWLARVFQSIAKTCRQGSRIATFTARGQVRRDLESMGFKMRKVDQQPHKRESLAGTFEPVGRSQPDRPKAVSVYGAGIAGAMVAHHLANENVNVTVIDPVGIAAGASRMHHTLMHPRLLGDGSTSAKFRSHAFHYATAYVDDLLPEKPSGALQLMGPNLNFKKIDRISRAYDADNPNHHHWIRALPDVAAEFPGMISEPGFWFSQSRQFDLAQLCKVLLSHANIQVTNLAPEHETHRVLCAASATRQFAGLDWLELADLGGQLDYLTFKHTSPAVPIVAQGYYLPQTDGAVVGSSYEYTPWSPDQATKHNININKEWLPSDFQCHSFQRAIRCVSSDRLPLVGRVEGTTTLLCTGMGSMGTSFAPMSASLVASELLGTLPAVSAEIANGLNPGRFLERQARRGVKHR